MKLINTLAALGCGFCVVVIVVGALALACRVFRPQLDAFDRGDAPLCCYAGVCAVLVGGLALCARRRA